LVKLGQEEYHHPSKLVPNKFQQAICRLLSERGPLRTDALAQALGSLPGTPFSTYPRRRLYKAHGLLELMDYNWVKRDDKVGYHLPDRLPPELKKILKGAPKGH
jgi:hypothetical protein